MAKLNISKRFSLVSEDKKKILTGALVAAAGAFITFVADAIPSVDFGQYTPFVVALVSVLVNAFRKWVSENKY
jgi:hypothetical protein